MRLMGIQQAYRTYSGDGLLNLARHSEGYELPSSPNIREKLYTAYFELEKRIQFQFKRVPCTGVHRPRENAHPSRTP